VGKVSLIISRRLEKEGEGEVARVLRSMRGKKLRVLDAFVRGASEDKAWVFFEKEFRWLSSSRRKQNAEESKKEPDLKPRSVAPKRRSEAGVETEKKKIGMVGDLVRYPQKALGIKMHCGLKSLRWKAVMTVAVIAGWGGGGEDSELR